MNSKINKQLREIKQLKENEQQDYHVIARNKNF